MLDGKGKWNCLFLTNCKNINYSDETTEADFIHLTELTNLNPESSIVGNLSTAVLYYCH